MRERGDAARGTAMKLELTEMALSLQFLVMAGLSCALIYF